MGQLKDDISSRRVCRQLHSRVVLLNHVYPCRFHIRRNHDLRLGVLLCEREDFRDREGFMDRVALPREFVADGVWEGAGEENDHHLIQSKTSFADRLKP